MTNEYGPPSEVIAARIKKVRQQRGFTAAQLADRCAELGAGDITAHTIANIESGRRDKETGRRRRHITADELLTLALALDVAPVHLLVPLDERGQYRLTSDYSLNLHVMRDWIRGIEPAPGGDRRLFFSEVPEHEWDADHNDVRQLRALFARFRLDQESGDNRGER